MASASNNFRCLGILAGASVSYKADSMFLINLTRTGSALLNAARLVYLCRGQHTGFYMEDLISYTDNPEIKDKKKFRGSPGFVSTNVTFFIDAMIKCLIKFKPIIKPGNILLRCFLHHARIEVHVSTASLLSIINVNLVNQQYDDPSHKT